MKTVTHIKAENETTSIIPGNKNKILISSSNDNTVKIWDQKNNLLINTLQHVAPVKSVILSQNDELLVSSCNNGTFFLWSLKDIYAKDGCKILKSFKLPTPNAITSILLSQSASVIVTGSEDKKVRIWSVETGKVIKQFSEHDSPITHLALSSDTKYLVSQSDNQVRIRFLDLAQDRGSYNSIALPINTEHQILSIAVSSDGKTIVTAGIDRKIIVWYWDYMLNNMVQKKAEIQYKNLVSSIVFEPYSELFITGDASGELGVWNTKGELLKSIPSKGVMCSLSCYIELNELYAVLGTSEHTLQTLKIYNQCDYANQVKGLRDSWKVSMSRKSNLSKTIIASRSFLDEFLRSEPKYTIETDIIARLAQQSYQSQLENELEAEKVLKEKTLLMFVKEFDRYNKEDSENQEKLKKLKETLSTEKESTDKLQKELAKLQDHNTETDKLTEELQMLKSLHESVNQKWTEEIALSTQREEDIRSLKTELENKQKDMNSLNAQIIAVQQTEAAEHKKREEAEAKLKEYLLQIVQLNEKFKLLQEASKNIPVVPVTINNCPTMSSIMSSSNTVSSTISGVSVNLEKINKEFEELRSKLLKEASALLAIDPQQKLLLESLLKKEGLEKQQIREKQYILAHSILNDYYYFFQLQFNDALLACHVIHSGMVANNDNTLWDTVADSLQTISKHIPIAGIVLDVLGVSLKTMNYREKKDAVNKGARFLVGASQIEKIGEELARQLTLTQIAYLHCQTQNKKELGFFRKHWNNLVDYKNKVMANDIDTDIRDLADQQCKRLLKAIFQGTIISPENNNIEPLLKEILTPFFYATPEARSQSFEAHSADTIDSGSISSAATSATSTQSAPFLISSQTATSTIKKIGVKLKTSVDAANVAQNKFRNREELEKEIEALRALQKNCCTIS